MSANLLSLGSSEAERGPPLAELALAPYKQLLMVLVVLVWALFGIWGRDPWKPVETEIVAVVLEMLESGRAPGIPTLFGEHILDTPPLYYWLAWLFAAVRPDFLEVHEAARAANLLLLFVTLLCIGATVSIAAHRRFAWDGILLLTGTMGLLFDFHLLSTHLMVMAGVSVQVLALALLPRATLSGGALFGIGAAVGFLSGGFLSLAASLLSLLILPLLSRRWLSTSSLLGLVVAAFFLAPAVGLWLILLNQMGPEAMQAWFAIDGRNWLANGIDPLGGMAKAMPHLIWSAWPLWPIVMIGLVKARKPILESRVVQAGAAIALAFLLVLVSAPMDRNSEAFAVYPPLAVVAAVSLRYLPKGSLSAFDWFALMMISFATVLLIWLFWLAVTFGWPAQYVGQITELRPGVKFGTPGLNVAVAAFATIGWIGLSAKISRGIHRPILNWSCGLALAWMLFSLLWLDYMDAGKSYRNIGFQLAKAHKTLLAQDGKGFCIGTGNLSMPEASQLYYFSGVALSQGENPCVYYLERTEANGKPAGISLGGRSNGDGLAFVLRRRGGSLNGTAESNPEVRPVH